MRDELRLYHETVVCLLERQAEFGNTPLTPNELSIIHKQAWAEVDADRSRSADAWARRKGLIK